MGLSKIILNIALKIVDILTFYIRPKKNHITFISLTQSELSSDFKLIDKGTSCGTLKISNNITKLKECILINQSPTGVFEQEVDLMKL